MDLSPFFGKLVRIIQLLRMVITTPDRTIVLVSLSTNPASFHEIRLISAFCGFIVYTLFKQIVLVYSRPVPTVNRRILLLEQFFGVLYWIAMIAMSIVLVAVTIAVFAIGVRFFKDSRRGLGTSCMAFSIVAAGMIYLMLNKQFF
ncbi:hypothetical protein D3C80_1339820 [compost metagenome]